MNRFLFRQVRLLNPDQNLDRTADLLLIDGEIAEIADRIDRAPEGSEEIDANGWIATPGLFDMHVHLREPGQTHKETIESGCASAANGGFTGVACMPNTSPAIDHAEVVHSILWKSENLPVDVHPVGAITRNRKGEELAPIGELHEAGVRMFSDDGDCVRSPEMMRRAFEYASHFGNAVLSQHCEEHSMTEGFAMNEGAVSTRLGLPGYPSVAEEIIIGRDIQLARYTGDRPYHVSHMSTAGGVELVRHARSLGQRNVTCEVAPHHFVLTDEAVDRYNVNAKMNPPLRTEEHRQAILEGFRDGTIDVIATDHAPHTPEEKDVEFPSAPNGIIGLETAVGLSWTWLVEKEVITAARFVELLAINPRRILSLEVPKIAKGERANLTFLSTESWTVRTEEFRSNCSNTPFEGYELKGLPIAVANRGEVIWSRLGGGKRNQS